jgi:hypothetical protein
VTICHLGNKSSIFLIQKGHEELGFQEKQISLSIPKHAENPKLFRFHQDKPGVFDHKLFHVPKQPLARQISVG